MQRRTAWSGFGRVAELADPRTASAQRHALDEMVMIALLASLALTALPGPVSLHRLTRLVKVDLTHRKTLEASSPSPDHPPAAPPQPRLHLTIAQAHR